MMNERRPNILLIIADHHRADAFGCAGNPVVQTPNLDRLAAEGTRFERAYCQGPVCTPARTSFLTERYVRDHGVDDNNREIPAGTPTFLHPLQAAGYHTACIGKTHVYVYRHTKPDVRLMLDRQRDLGFAESVEVPAQMTTGWMGSDYADALKQRGVFQIYRDWVDQRTPGRGTATVNGQPVERLPEWHAESCPLPPDLYIDTWVGDRAVRWLEEYERDEPFVLWVGFPGPHNPWDAPAEYVARYRDVDIPLPATKAPELPPDSPMRDFLARRIKTSIADELTPERVREVARFFYANITLIDERVGEIVAALARTGRLEDTWIVYTSDHGEMLGEHGLLGKGVFYEPSVRVPLIIRPPAGRQWANANGLSGRVVRDLVQHVDAAATIREIAGAGPVAESEGRSLLDGPARSVVYSQNLGFMMAATERYKLVVDDQSATPVQLFDLESDPLENENLVADPHLAAVREELMNGYVLPHLSGGVFRQPTIEDRLQVVIGRPDTGRA
jgi:choline-sulfatase